MELQALALRIIETICDLKFSIELKRERIPLKGNVGRLSYQPFISIDSVFVRSSNWAHAKTFGSTDWASVDVGSIDFSYPMFVVPGGVLDAQFDEAEVTYTVGFESIPDVIQNACELLVSKLQTIPNPQTYAIMSLITPEIMNLIAPFIQNGGETVENVLPHHRGIQTSAYRNQYI